MGRRHKPSRWPVNWTVVSVAAALTLVIGITVAFLSNGDKKSGIVVPTPSTTSPPALIAPTESAGITPAAGTSKVTTKRGTPTATILPGR